MELLKVDTLEVAREKLEKAVSIILESDTNAWNADSTGGRYLVWVWYKTAEDTDYHCLNLEILQQGLALASKSSDTCYADICVTILNQAVKHKLHVHSKDKDPDFYYGEAIPVTLKGLRTTIEQYENMKVTFEGVITHESNQTVYVEEYDEEKNKLVQNNTSTYIITTNFQNVKVFCCFLYRRIAFLFDTVRQNMLLFTGYTGEFFCIAAPFAMVRQFIERFEITLVLGEKTMKNVKANRQAKIMDKVIDGTVSLDNLQAMENIDFLNVLNPIQLMQKIYNAESLVGAVTVVVGNICNVDVTDPAAFKEFKEKLVMLKGNKTHVPYGDSIWVQGVNVFMGYHFVTGHFYCYYVVTNDEMKAIEDKDKIKAIPIIPIEPAKAVNIVRPFLVSKLFKLNENAVGIDIEDFPKFLCFGFSSFDSFTSNGFVSP